MTGLWNLKDIQNRRQNPKNKLDRENAVTPAHGRCSLRVMGYGCMPVLEWSELERKCLETIWGLHLM